MGLSVQVRPQPACMYSPSRSSAGPVAARPPTAAPSNGVLLPGRMVDDLNRMMRGWANYFSLEQVSPAYRAIDRHAVRRLRQWLCRRHEVRFGRTVRFPDERLWQQYGLTRLVTRISQGAPSTVCRLKPSNQALQDVKDEHWPTRSRLARYGHRAVLVRLHERSGVGSRWFLGFRTQPRD